ncbi:MAG: hypothetical protein COA78_36480 [Blastopirellula sp.]|nr:MAG: hypothetical protein COA78_36480 [Blastopirellula sp.]
MRWTQQQCEVAFNDFWKSERTKCPNDNSIVNLKLTHFMNGEYLISGFCPACGEGIEMGRTQDPRKAGFRKWTEEEESLLNDAHFQGNSADCPVCDSHVEMQSVPIQQGTIITSRCIRCANGGENTIRHDRV